MCKGKTNWNQIEASNLVAEGKTNQIKKSENETINMMMLNKFYHRVIIVDLCIWFAKTLTTYELAQSCYHLKLDYLVKRQTN